MHIDAGRFIRAVLILGAAGAAVLATTALRTGRGRAEAVSAAIVEQVRGVEPGLSLGRADAAVVVRIFGDYQCPSCRVLENEIGDQLRALARSGRLRYVYVHAPLEAHRRAPLAALLLRCAARMTDPWALHAELYRTSDSWGSGPPSENAFRTLAARTMADTSGLGACRGESDARNEVEAEIALSRQIGIEQVPTVWIDHDRIGPASGRAVMRIVRSRIAQSRPH